jgi:aryl-alcohol dehydrogenase-like predicted oxidoreductase
LGEAAPSRSNTTSFLLSSAAYGTRLPDEERLAFLDRAYALGERFWDTADVYGDSEDLLGRWFSLHPEKRQDIFLATKFAARIVDGQHVMCSTPEYCKEAIERSLKRLGVEYVDLYYCHRVDGVTPIERTMRALLELQRAGQIRYIGLSEVSAATLRRASKIARVHAVQIEYSPWSLDIENEKVGLLKACRELGVAVVAYSPIGRGMLSGQIRSVDDLGKQDARRMQPRFAPEAFARNLVLVDQIVALAREKRVTPTQLVLAWLLAQGKDVIPIPGTTKVERLEENLGALGIELTVEEVGRIRKVVEAAEVHGTRYPEATLRYTFGDTPKDY